MTEVDEPEVDENPATGTGGGEQAKAGSEGRKALALLALGGVIIAAAFGASGYLLGKSTGEDLDAARLSGQVAGQKAGTTKGTSAGYAQGFKRGRKKGFEQTYGRTYRHEYAEEFEQAGLEQPALNEIKVPKQ